MADRIGIQVAPDVLEMLFRVGATVSGAHGFKACLTENGVPDDHKLVRWGYDRDQGQFFFIFAPKLGGEAGPVVWQAPIYEKEDGDGANL
jgi:hypothetical protein